jgi:endonuclease YncB( thermonuclease family)
MRSVRWLRQLAVLVLLFLLMFVIAEFRTPPERLTADGAAVQVIDGDSLRVGARTVRLQGIDAVEYQQPCRATDGTEWRCGVDARKALAGLVGKGGLVCESQATDSFGRAVSSCSTNGVEDIGAALVAQGWAVSGDGEREGAYTAQQQAAQASKRGIWRGEFDRPAVWRAAHPRSAPSVPAR